MAAEILGMAHHPAGLTNRSKLLLLEHFPSPEDIYYAQPEDLPPVEGLSSLSGGAAVGQVHRPGRGRAGPLRQGGYLPADHAGRPHPTGCGTSMTRRCCCTDGADAPVRRGGRVSVVAYRIVPPMASPPPRSWATSWRRRVPWWCRALPRASTEPPTGALRAGGFTAAVLGGGVDVVYPAENRRLYEDIAATGVLLSEYPPGTEPVGSHFPSATASSAA